MNQTGYLSVEQLKKDVADGSIDTVVVVMTDMQGRLVGKRIAGQFFLDEIVKHGTEGCNYLLAAAALIRICKERDIALPIKSSGLSKPNNSIDCTSYICRYWF